MAHYVLTFTPSPYICFQVKKQDRTLTWYQCQRILLHTYKANNLNRQLLDPADSIFVDRTALHKPTLVSNKTLTGVKALRGTLVTCFSLDPFKIYCVRWKGLGEQKHFASSVVTSSAWIKYGFHFRKKRKLRWKTLRNNSPENVVIWQTF